MHPRWDAYDNDNKVFSIFNNTVKDVVLGLLQKCHIQFRIMVEEGRRLRFQQQRTSNPENTTNHQYQTMPVCAVISPISLILQVIAERSLTLTLVTHYPESGSRNLKSKLALLILCPQIHQILEHRSKRLPIPNMERLSKQTLSEIKCVCITTVIIYIF